MKFYGDKKEGKRRGRENLIIYPKGALLFQNEAWLGTGLPLVSLLVHLALCHGLKPGNELRSRGPSLGIGLPQASILVSCWDHP